jgi:hypothetical protein
VIASGVGWSMAEIMALPWDQFIAELITARRYEGFDQ